MVPPSRGAGESPCRTGRARRALRLVRRWNGLGLLEFHFLAAAAYLTGSGLDAQYLSPTCGTAVSLAELTSHRNASFVARAVYFFSSIGWPQQWISPLPALVTINSLPHLVQWYLLPIWFAILCHPPAGISSGLIIGCGLSSSQGMARTARARPLTESRDCLARPGGLNHPSPAGPPALNGAGYRNRQSLSAAMYQG